MHFAGHLRAAFCEWLDEGCPPLARVEVGYTPQTWDATRLLRTMRRCTDIMPRTDFDLAVEELGETPKWCTYGCVARMLLDQRLAAH